MQTITQTQIAAYERCRRFYYLKYIRKLAWPAEKANVQKMKKGENFHLLVRQLIMGFPKDKLLIPEKDEKISRWIDNYCQKRPLDEFDRVMAEKEVSSLYADILWLGKFDVLAFRDDHLTIFDWKTTSSRTDPGIYRQSPQTRLYRFLAKVCGPRLLEAGPHEIPAENIEMVYWFPEYPDLRLDLPYSEDEYQQDLTYLKLKAREMSSVSEADFPVKENQRSCPVCDYYAYCFPERAGIQPIQTETGADGLADPEDDLFQPDLFSFPPPEDTDREETYF